MKIPVFLSTAAPTILLLSFIRSSEALAATANKKNKRPAAGGGGGGGGFGAPKTAWKVHTTDETEATKRLLDFLQSQNADMDNAEIGFGPGGMRGLFANKKISKGKMICKIPSNCVLALSDPSKRGEDAPTVAHGGSNLLKMYFHPQDAKELWAPYLDTLPKNPSDAATPDFFTDEEVQLLEFPRLVQSVKQRKQDIQQVAAEQGLSEDELQYATWLVSTRALNIQISQDGSVNDEEEVMRDERGQVITSARDRKSIRVLVPFLDCANHKSQPNAKLTLIDPEKDDAWFALQATRNIGPGKEIAISYGSGVDSSVELLQNYGFVDVTNEIDSLMLEKGGDDAITSPDGWTTTLQEDKTMLDMLAEEDDENGVLQKILTFRIKLKESYKKD